MAPFVGAPAGTRMSFDRGSDPLTLMLAPAKDETAAERTARLAKEQEERRVSEAIDRAIELEAKERKKVARGESELLLLGPAGAGKTTFVKQLRLAYDPNGLKMEREASRLVILLNIVQSTRALLSLLEDESNDAVQQSASPEIESTNAFRPTSSSGREGGRTDQELAYLRRVRLAPLLGLESQLREALGAVTTGPSATSMAAHANDGISESTFKLGWLDAAPTEQDLYESSDVRPNARAPHVDRQKMRSRAASPAHDQHDPIFAPNFAERLGTVAFGSGKESRRARAQQGTAAKGNAGKVTSGERPTEDPINLLVVLKGEVQALWLDAVSKGYVAGEGPRASSLGGHELSESARYFFTSLDRIAKPDWEPNDADMLNVRVRTLGIEQHTLQITETQRLRICDVAGARGIKPSWAPFFDSCAAIIFIVASSDYTFADPRDPRQNRFCDALALFEDVISLPVLRHVTMIVFLNKVDLLRRKVKSGLHPVSRYLPTYRGGDKTADVLTYMQSRFEQLHERRKQIIEDAPKALYCYAIQANDSKSTRFVLAAVTDILMRGSLSASGLL